MLWKQLTQEIGLSLKAPLSVHREKEARQERCAGRGSSNMWEQSGSRDPAS
jgi:hypothetical protein